MDEDYARADQLHAEAVREALVDARAKYPELYSPANSEPVILVSQETEYSNTGCYCFCGEEIPPGACQCRACACD